MKKDNPKNEPEDRDESFLSLANIGRMVFGAIIGVSVGNLVLPYFGAIMSIIFAGVTAALLYYLYYLCFRSLRRR